MVMDREKLTAGAFAESIGVAQATISHILGPRNKYPSTEVILRLHQRYNDINLEWIHPKTMDSTILYSPRIRKICPTGRKNLKIARKLH
jgi:transcriptional regulator with XRE-family HTH domain